MKFKKLLVFLSCLALLPGILSLSSCYSEDLPDEATDAYQDIPDEALEPPEYYDPYLEEEYQKEYVPLPSESLPEWEMWYNAEAQAGDYGTVAGPIVRIYQAADSPGQPIFIDLGNPYPDMNRFTVVVWAEDYEYFADLFSSTVEGSTWLEISGYISIYDGVPQYVSSDSGCEFKWWDE